MMKEDRIVIANAITIICVFIGAVVLWGISLEVLQTSIKLYSISDNIQFYNDQPVKTDEWTEKIEILIKKRQEEFYHSNHKIVRLYSNANAMTKLYVLYFAIFFLIGIPFSMVYQLYRIISYKNSIKMKEERKEIEEWRQRRKRLAEYYILEDEEYMELCSIFQENVKNSELS